MSSVFPPSFPDLGDDAPPDRQVAQLRIPPHSIEAESSVLGGLLLDNGAWDRVADLINDSDFYRYEHRLTYSAIAALVKQTGAIEQAAGKLGISDLNPDTADHEF